MQGNAHGRRYLLLRVFKSNPPRQAIGLATPATQLAADFDEKVFDAMRTQGSAYQINAMTLGDRGQIKPQAARLHDMASHRIKRQSLPADHRSEEHTSELQYLMRISYA